MKDSDDPRYPKFHYDFDFVYLVGLRFCDSADVDKTRSAYFSDPDAYGSIQPTIDTIRLDASKTWFCDMSFNFGQQLDEKEDHLCCYEPQGMQVQIEVLDKDANGLKVGTQTKWRPTVSGKGFVKFRLMHQPGTKNGDCDHGETDIEVIFPILVE